MCTAIKAWFFADTVAGAKAGAMVYRLLLICRASGVQPDEYLLHVPTELSQRASDADVIDLLPCNFTNKKVRRCSPERFNYRLFAFDPKLPGNIRCRSYRSAIKYASHCGEPGSSLRTTASSARVINRFSI